MSKTSATPGDCYSAGERVWMLRGQQFRGRLLEPMLRQLASWRVTPNQLTLLSLVAGLAFCPLIYWSPIAALVALTLHILIDGLDGPLARHLGIASRSGSFTDTMADQVVVVATTVNLMTDKVVHVLPGGIYIFLYTVVVLFAIARNILKIPYSWVVRPRFIVYSWIAVDLYLLPGTLNYLLWFFNALLAIKMLTGFLQISKRM